MPDDVAHSAGGIAMTNQEILALAGKLNSGAADAGIPDDIGSDDLHLLIVALKIIEKRRYFITTDSPKRAAMLRAFAENCGWNVQVVSDEFHPLTRWLAREDEHTNLLI
jgi:hypothetical protein